MRLAIALACLACPAWADMTDALSDHILPRQNALTEATTILADTANQTCTPEEVIPVFHAAYDAWIDVSHIQFGPIEDHALTLAMAFWPDPKDSTGKAIGRLISAQDPIVDDRTAFRDVSAAAQGFTALERLLFEPQGDAAYACRLTRAIADTLAAKAAQLRDGWDSFGDLMRSAGADGNTRFQSEDEAKRALYTALSSGLEFLHDQRLGRPLGTFDRPRPRRAEARRSARSLRHIALSLASLEDLAQSFAGPNLPEIRAAFAEARARVEDLDDPTLAGVANPAQRFKVEVLQQSVRAIQMAVIDEIGAPLGISAGFNSLDGD